MIKEFLTINQLEDYTYGKNEIGRSKSQVYKLTKDTTEHYLKIGNEEVNNLRIVLEFLDKTQISVPKIVKAGTYQQQHYVLMTACEGEMTHQLTPELAMKVLGKGLKELHSIPCQDFEIIRDHDYYLQELNNKIDSYDDEQMKLYNLFKNANLNQELSFIHGDYCLPNILYKNGEISIIDLDHSCVSFRSIDLMDCIWSIKYNFKEQKYVDIFLDEYGRDNISFENIEACEALFKLI